MDLSLGNIINVSISEIARGVSEYNTSNLAIFSKEVPGPSFGNLGYKIYLESSEVAKDWGSASKTYKEAVAVFTPTINIKNNRGYLVIFAMNQATPLVPGTSAKFKLDAFVADAGDFKIKINAFETAAIAYNADANAIQAALVAAGLANAIVTVDNGFVIDSGLQLPVASHSIEDNTLENASVPVVLTFTMTANGVAPIPAVPAETYQEAYLRTKDLVSYFGIVLNSVVGDVEAMELAQMNQAEDRMLFLVFNTEAAIGDGGIASQIRDAGLTRTRVLYYEDTEIEALRMVSTYASRMLSVNFEGNNTTLTDHLKDLTGILADKNLSQTKYLLAKKNGAVVYASFRGVPKVSSTGVNLFFDQVYNSLWLKGKLEVVLFNVLAQTQTKIPQTEEGMDVYKNGAVSVCEIAKRNGYCAKGKWTRPDTFGVLEDFHRNIEDIGYYIYTLPITEQSAAERDERHAPLMQIALKEAGAIHDGTVIVNINK